MKNNKKENRKKGAFESKFGDKIITAIPMDDYLLVICENSLHEMKTPEDVDPDDINPDTPATQCKIMDIGYKHPAITKMVEFLVALDKHEFGIYQAISYKKHIDEKLLSIKKLIFETFNSLINIEQKFNNLSELQHQQAQSLDIEEIVKARVITKQPYIPNLEDIIKNIVITELGHSLRNLIHLFILFFDNKLSNSDKSDMYRNDKRLDCLLEICQKKNVFKQDNDFLKYLENNINDDWLKKLIAIRNSLEHPDDRKKIIIKNFVILPDRKVNAPTWKLIHPQYENEQEEFLVTDLQKYCENLIGFIFNFVGFCIIENFEKAYFTENGSIYAYKPPE